MGFSCSMENFIQTCCSFFNLVKFVRASLLLNFTWKVRLYKTLLFWTSVPWSVILIRKSPSRRSFQWVVVVPQDFTYRLVNQITIVIFKGIWNWWNNFSVLMCLAPWLYMLKMPCIWVFLCFKLKQRLFPIETLMNNRYLGHHWTEIFFSLINLQQSIISNCLRISKKMLAVIDMTVRKSNNEIRQTKQ